MSNYDRFKPTSLKKMAERKEEVQKITNDSDDDFNGKFKKLNVKKDGTYKIRVYPPHPIDGANSLEAKVIYFVPSMRKKRNANNQYIKDNDGKEILEKYNRPVFDSRVHGEAPYDLIDTYISLTKKKAESLYPDNKDAQKNYLLPILGNRFSGGTLNGLNAQRTFLMYGDLIEGTGENESYTFHEFEVHKAIEKGMQKIAASENNDDPLGTDGCFTDPLDGRPLKIVVDSIAGKLDSSNYYVPSIVNDMEKVNINGKLVNAMKQFPIPEEKLDWYDKEIDPLINYRKKFTGKDLDIQLKGLILFDEEFGFNVMDTDEFKDVYNALDKLFPKVDDTNNTSSDSDNTSNNTGHASADEYDLMDMAELKAYIIDAQLPITVLNRYSEADVRDIIREVEKDQAQKSNTSPVPDVKEPVVEQSAPIVEETKVSEAESNPAALAATETTVSTGTGVNWRDRVNNLGAKVGAATE